MLNRGALGVWGVYFGGFRSTHTTRRGWGIGCPIIGHNVGMILACFRL